MHAHANSVFSNYMSDMTLIFDLLTSGSMHAMYVYQAWCW